MSAYLVSLDTLELLGSVLCRWRTSTHESGTYVHLFDDTTEPPAVSDLAVTDATAWSARHVRIGRDDLTAVVRELYAANVRSLAARYPGDDMMVGYALPDDYRAREVSRDDATLAQAFGAVKCYEYQACEFPEWRQSFAHALTGEILNRLAMMASPDCWEYVRPSNLTGSQLAALAAVSS